MDDQDQHPEAATGFVPHESDAEFTADDLEPRPFTAPPRRRVLWTLGILAVLVLLAVVPPLFNVNRLQKKIAASISQSLGRPVHTGEVTLDLLPWPGFTIANFVVSEDPAFGFEPVIRASSVKGRLRWRSLWRGRLEFSRITLSDASVNLVRRSVDGQWNLESILLQASRMPAAPTAQRGPGDRPRFPYIEATGARLNVKMGLEKMPLSLTEADFALWLPQPEQWHLRLEGHPARTDTAATDTGVVRLEGTIGRAARLPDVPVALNASWTAAPLGAASYVVTGTDAGYRGELNLTAGIQGTAGRNTLVTRLRMTRVRRADFVPASLLEVDLSCTAQALANLHRLADLRCTWPAGEPGTGLLVTGQIPDTLAPGSARLQIDLTRLPAASLLDGLRVGSRHIAPELTLAGTVSAHATCCTPGEWLGGWTNEASLDLQNAQLSIGGSPSYLSGDLHGALTQGALTFAPVPLDLGGATPARFTLAATPAGYSMTLAGPAQRDRVLALAAAVPLLGDGLPTFLGPDRPGRVDPFVLDATANRTWSGPRDWSAPAVAAPPRSPRKRSRH